MRDYKLPYESEKPLTENNDDPTIYREIYITWRELINLVFSEPVSTS